MSSTEGVPQEPDRPRRRQDAINRSTRETPEAEQHPLRPIPGFATGG